MPELIVQIMSLPRTERLKIAMQILLSIHDEEDSAIPSEHEAELKRFQDRLEEGKVDYSSEKDFWKEVRKRVS